MSKFWNGELVNPLVSPHLIYVPKLRINQCQKWREDYPPDLRVQIISSESCHYYVYEPVQLQTEQLVVPIFFFQQDACLMARCLPAIFKQDLHSLACFKVIIPGDAAFDSDILVIIPCKNLWQTCLNIEVADGVFLKDMCSNYMYMQPAYPMTNPWREKAQGKVICHVPLALYSDDTLGNVAKKWNKHMSIYFTLAGLPPALSNKEFNIHFLATPNCATALEMFDQVVDDLK
ncbi:hypothetical protein DFH28DRAFT_1085197 [Melampsora americana]|nr:hypothetical protein DFH28DRAFT_1085197 [Melampsora americana]